MKIILLILTMFILAFSQASLDLIRIEVDVTPPPEPPAGGSCDDTLAGVWPQSYMYQGAYTLPIPKCFAYIVKATGEINCFRFYIYEWSGDRTSDSLIVAVYDNRRIGGVDWPGRMRCYHFEENYDFTQNGLNSWHALETMTPRFVGGNTLTAGDTVWVVLHSEARDLIAVERSSSAFYMTSRVGVNNATCPVSYAAIDSAEYDMIFGSWNSSSYGYLVMGDTTP